MVEAETLRRDARDNVEKLKAAARDVFQARGLGAPLEEVARAAGVSIGTVYNRFTSREGLIDAVIPQIAAARFDRMTADALALESPWERFAAYVEGMVELQTSDRAMNDVIARRYPDAAKLLSVCDNLLAVGRNIIEEAHAEGSLRSDFGSEDLFALLWTHALAARADDAPQGWRRVVGFTLAGLHT